jgi:hypothetical protein
MPKYIKLQIIPKRRQKRGGDPKYNKIRYTDDDLNERLSKIFDEANESPNLGSRTNENTIVVSRDDFLKFVPYAIENNALTQDSMLYKKANDLWITRIENTHNEEIKAKKVIEYLKKIDVGIASKFWTTAAKDSNLNAIEKLSFVFQNTSLETRNWWRNYPSVNVAYNLQNYRSIVSYLKEIAYIFVVWRNNPVILKALVEHGFITTFNNLNNMWKSQWVDTMRQIALKYQHTYSSV